LLPGGNRLVVGEKTKVEFQTVEGKPLQKLLAEYPETEINPHWQITKGEGPCGRFKFKNKKKKRKKQKRGLEGTMKDSRGGGGKGYCGPGTYGNRLCYFQRGHVIR
jgi:hypothetical protein